MRHDVAAWLLARSIVEIFSRKGLRSLRNAVWKPERRRKPKRTKPVKVKITGARMRDLVTKLGGTVKEKTSGQA